ncbi:MAG: methyltransferase domain-containing protein [Actinobacteria bacterium]|nr:methyltransferase domain-containing protein [Actinomycetota bacterium]
MSLWESPEDIVAALQAYSSAAALGAALELGLPRLLESGPQDAAVVAASLGMPVGRCRWWLQVLVHLGLLERTPGGYGVAAAARRALSAYRPESWAFLAREERERLPAVVEAPARLTRPAVAGEAAPEDYLAKMAADPERARAFTRMLYDLHRGLATRLTEALDLAGARRLLDLGGGSGVMSLALLDRHPGLSAVVVDLTPVCAEGRRIAAERGLQDRIEYLEGDFLTADLPGRFDLVLECDVGVYPEALFPRVRGALEPGGRFLIVDLMADAGAELPERELHWGFTAALAGPSEPPMTWARLREVAAAGGFRPGQERELGEGYRLLEARP